MPDDDEHWMHPDPTTRSVDQRTIETPSNSTGSFWAPLVRLENSHGKNDRGDQGQRRHA
jgi:hypothetical protein